MVLTLCQACSKHFAGMNYDGYYCYPHFDRDKEMESLGQSYPGNSWAS